MKPTTEDIVLKLLKNIEISKAAGIDNLPGRFLMDGAVILAKSFYDDTANWFHLFLTDREFLVNIENKYSSISKISHFAFPDIRP